MKRVDTPFLLLLFNALEVIELKIVQLELSFWQRVMECCGKALLLSFIQLDL